MQQVDSNLFYHFLSLDINLIQDAIPSIIFYSEKIKKTFNICPTLELRWIYTPPCQLEDNITKTFEKIKKTLTNSNQIIVLWLEGFHLPLEWSTIIQLNKFSESIQNPVIYCSGSLGLWPNNFKGQLKFTIAQLMYFEYESCLHWDMQANGISNNVKRNKKFLSMGTKDYPNRKFLLSNIINNNLLEYGYVSYKQVNSGELNLNYYTRDEITTISRIANSIDKYLPLLILDNSIEYTQMPRNFLLDSYVNMVTDTYYETPPNVVYLSEKIFNAIAHWQIFVFMGPAYTLEHLRSEGYQTFGDYIDESYDTIENNYERLVAVTKSFINFVSQPIEVIEDIYIKCLPIVEHNKRRLSKNQFTTKINNELLRAIKENKLFH
jgi:hypothetical protein